MASQLHPTKRTLLPHPSRKKRMVSVSFATLCPKEKPEQSCSCEVKIIDFVIVLLAPVVDRAASKAGPSPNEKLEKPSTCEPGLVSACLGPELAAAGLFIAIVCC